MSDRRPTAHRQENLAEHGPKAWPRPSWQRYSLCRSEDPELFFPVGDAGPALRQIAEAKAVCERCPVRSLCLDWALSHQEDAGVWGGRSEQERRVIRRRLAREALNRTSPRPAAGAR